MIGTARFSGCGRYRYNLTRIWDETKPIAAWCLLNPSTADGDSNDPTTTRVTDFTREWGYGGFILVNAFAWKATEPKDLRIPRDPVGPENNSFIREAALKAEIMILGWGNPGVLHGRGAWVFHKVLRGIRTHCLGVNENGQPKHPLYVKATTELREFKWRIF